MLNAKSVNWFFSEHDRCQLLNMRPNATQRANSNTNVIIKSNHVLINPGQPTLFTYFIDPVFYEHAQCDHRAVHMRTGGEICICNEFPRGRYLVW